MKIAVWHNLPSGGAKRALYDHVRGLVARGHAVEAWCPPTADPNFLPLSSLIPEHVVDLAFTEVYGGISRWYIERSIAAMDAHCKQCAEQIEKGGFDVLFANTCRFFRTSSIAKYTKLPSVLYLQEPFREFYEALARMWWITRPAGSLSILRPSRWRKIVGFWLRFRRTRAQAREEVDNAAAFDKILVNSYFSRESVIRAYGLNSDVCYLGIDTAHFVDRGLPREDYVVGLGSVTEAKNLDLVIEAIGAMPAPRPRLVWVGNIAIPWYRAAMIELAQTRGVVLDLRVGISDDELLEVLNRAFVMVYAPHLEPFGLSPLEACACGVPVVAVAEGGVRETIRHELNGLLVDRHPSNIACAISRIRDNPDFCRELGANARTLVANEWSFESAIARLEGRLTSCLRAFGNDPLIMPNSLFLKDGDPEGKVHNENTKVEVLHK